MPTRNRLAVLVFILAAVAALPASAADCAGLAHANLTSTEITSASTLPQGAFTPPIGEFIKHVTSFCRVTGVMKPTSDSYIRFEVWLPEADWNGKYLGVGNGGFAGTIDYSSMANNVNNGYATAASDTGHQAESADATWAYHHPEKITDFGYRALHLTTVNAKALIKTFYNQPVAHSYFSSCSDGGREALIEAQRFPDDFDGILAGAPANDWTHLVSAGVAGAQALISPAGYISSLKLPAIHKAVLSACDAQDGVKDGVINDPVRCHFNPSELLCKGPESTTCLTQPQINALNILYTGAKDSHGNPVFPGFMPGSENGWSQWVVGFAPGGSLMSAFVENYFRYMVFDDAHWNVLTASIDESVRRANEKTAEALNATNPDLKPFQSRGGKLILYHGWNDPAISPLNTIHYYQEIQKTMTSSVASQFVRLYMVPGMQHCGGGAGPNVFGQFGPAKDHDPTKNIYFALENWVEGNQPPAQITATKYAGDSWAGKAVMTRPLCPYPEIAEYKGSGDTSNASSFTCAAQ
ncbi:MAG TPA: tannase/feruloyl esterase family alpha/beta hydrolase [Bryobacteraceae bacterium]|nr:tannase/feruloyl esterase family alpha/beta hydrolase [Bryobacteraceae bacterium]